MADKSKVKKLFKKRGIKWVNDIVEHHPLFNFLGHLGKFTILIALVFWIWEGPKREQEAIRSAWSIVNSKGG